MWQLAKAGAERIDEKRRAAEQSEGRGQVWVQGRGLADGGLGCDCLLVITQGRRVDHTGGTTTALS